MKEVSPLPGEEALYAWIQSVWEAASNDSQTKQAYSRCCNRRSRRSRTSKQIVPQGMTSNGWKLSELPLLFLFNSS